MTAAKLSREDASVFDQSTREYAVERRLDYYQYVLEIPDPAAKGAAYALHMLRRMVEMRKDSPAGFGGDAFGKSQEAIEHREFTILRNTLEAVLKRAKLTAADSRELLVLWREVMPSFLKSSLVRPISNAVERAKLIDDPAFLAWLPDAVACTSQISSADRAWVAKARKWMGLDDCPSFSQGEVFGEAAQNLVAHGGSHATTWGRVLSHAQRASGSTPSRAWLKEAAAMLKSLGHDEFTQALADLFIAAEKPRTAPAQINSYITFDAGSYELTDTSQDVLKGLAWMAASIDTPEMSRALGRLTLSAYKKVPGRGPRAVKVGNAAVWALSQQSSEASLGQLAMLNVKVKFGTAQKMIEKALNVVAAARGLPRAEIDELGVPSYGLEQVGRREDTLGETRLLLEVRGAGDVSLRYFKADGKEVKSPPAALKQNFADDLKEFKASLKDIETMLSAQVARLDGLMGSQRVWSADNWQARYMQHPLIGVLARGLIWTTGEGNAARAFVWSSGECVDATGQKVATPTGDQQVRLWHPIDATREQVVAWREYFESRRIKQPFKQAHREVYLLTDAERRTATYSNRFAAHVIKQHQFHALALLRGWKNKLRLSVDAEFPATSKIIPWAGLRAEFWVEGIGDDYGVDTNDAGVYNLLATDQVRFYRAEAGENVSHAGSSRFEMNAARAEINEPVPIEQVPALALSEVLRDVDLFVGVCSVGNNPQWQDGGPEGRHRDYWWNFSFAENLTESGSQRRDLLQRLIPRLAIRDLCTFTDRFLVVKGKLRTYKIHLGSGNILMEPNDQYLCIVPGRSDAAPSDVFLPFDGDRVLSIILSKALMLAEDDKIKDSSITSQIRAK
jgi:hypothetical protein